MTRRNVLVPLAVACAIAALACGSPPPEYVWVAGPGFEAAVQVRLAEDAAAECSVGDRVHLQADRSTGPWVRVRHREIDPGTAWLVQPPAAQEHDVQANVRWLVSPPGAAEFNVFMAWDLTSRRVRFAEPGTYTLWAESHDWAGGTVSSN